MKNTH